MILATHPKYPELGTGIVCSTEGQKTVIKFDNKEIAFLTSDLVFEEKHVKYLKKDARRKDTWKERAYATLFDFRGAPQTKDSILARMNEVFELNSAQHNNVAPTFSPGQGGLWDEKRVVLVSRKAGVTRTGSAADEWIADDFATPEQIVFSDAEWERTMQESLQDMKQLLIELPKKISDFEQLLERRKNLKELANANND